VFDIEHDTGHADDPGGPVGDRLEHDRIPGIAFLDDQARGVHPDGLRLHELPRGARHGHRPRLVRWRGGDHRVGLGVVEQESSSFVIRESDDEQPARPLDVPLPEVGGGLFQTVPREVARRHVQRSLRARAVGIEDLRRDRVEEVRQNGLSREHRGLLELEQPPDLECEDEEQGQARGDDADPERSTPEQHGEIR
jgi:hypothetical protein